MDPSKNTGPVAPGWIREQVARFEGAWPLAAWSAGMVLVIAVTLAMGALIWTADAIVYYAPP
jgi:hypothetical protein